MGKLQKTQSSNPASSSQSVHSLQLFDHEDSNLLADADGYEEPPSYDAAVTTPPESESINNNHGLSLPSMRLIDADYTIPGGRGAQSVRSSVRNTHIVSLEPALSQYMDDLSLLMAQQVRLPPRPQIVIQGTHTESSTNHNDNKKQSSVVTDFHFRLDLAETLLSGWENAPTAATRRLLPQSVWYRASVSSDNDGRKTYRGTRLKCLNWKEPKSGKKFPTHSTVSDDLETGNPESQIPYRDEEEAISPENTERDAETTGNGDELLQWCLRYCEDPSPVKSYVYRPTLLALP